MAFINQFPYSDFHELNADWIILKTKDLLTRMEKIEEDFKKIEVLTEEQINTMIQTAILTNNVELYNAINRNYDRITSEYRSYINNSIDDLRLYIDNQDIYYDNLAKGYALMAQTNANNYTDQKVLNFNIMVNPITGQLDDVRNVVSDIIIYFHSENTLTAGEYDALNMTASAYDTKSITAYEYDFNGKTLLP